MNCGSSNIPIIFWTCVCITQIKAHCGFPDQPINGKVVVTSEGETLVAKYECPQSFAIDGDLRRTCSEGRWSGIPPRCADEKEKKTNCKISHVGEWSTFSFPKNIHLARVTITSPVNYIDLFRDAEWRLSLFLENTTVANKSNGIFHETETSLANDHFASIQWHLNDTADSISLKHEKGITYACETIVYAFPDECGDPEMLINGIVSVAGNTATYACRPGFSSPQASRECVMGRWIGEIPECRLPTPCSTADHQADSVYLPWLIAVGLLLTLGVLIVFLLRLHYLQENSTLSPSSLFNWQAV